MKKSTKIIATAIALVLVMSFMVVGILAATSAAASITASVSWTATAGLNFRVEGWTVYSKEHIDYLEEQAETPNSIIEHGYSIEDYANIKTLISVDTKTTNESASGMTATLNSTFIDDSDDGVNNPRDIYYCYKFQNLDADEYGKNLSSLIVNFTKLPSSTENVTVMYEWGSTGSEIGLAYSSLEESVTKTTGPTSLTISAGEAFVGWLAIRLHIETPDENLTGFDAGISCSFSVGS